MKDLNTLWLILYGLIRSTGSSPVKTTRICNLLTGLERKPVGGVEELRMAAEFIRLINQVNQEALKGMPPSDEPKKPQDLSRN